MGTEFNLQPKNYRISPFQLIALALSMAAFASIAVTIAKQGLTANSITTTLMVVALIAALVVWLLDLNRRLLSIRLSDKGVSMLFRVKVRGKIFPALENYQMPWEDVVGVRTVDTTIWLHDKKRRIGVNVLLFKEPEKVKSLIFDTLEALKKA